MAPKNSEHPIWKTVHVATYGAISMTAMWIFATEVDETEVRSLIAILSSGLVYEFVFRRKAS